MSPEDPASIGQAEPTAGPGETPEDPHARADEKPGVTPLSVLTGLAVAVLLSFLNIWFMEKRISHPPPSFGYLPMVPVMVMLLLIVLNVPLKLIGRLLGLRTWFGTGRRRC